MCASRTFISPQSFRILHPPPLLYPSPSQHAWCKGMCSVGRRVGTVGLNLSIPEILNIYNYNISKIHKIDNIRPREKKDWQYKMFVVLFWDQHLNICQFTIYTRFGNYKIFTTFHVVTRSVPYPCFSFLRPHKSGVWGRIIAPPMGRLCATRGGEKWFCSIFF